MNTLAQRISARSGDQPIMRSRGLVLERDALTTLAPNPRIGTRPALSIRNPDALLRLLSACDGRVDAILLLSAELPEKEVSALMVDAEATALVSDRDGFEERVAPLDACVTVDSKTRDAVQTEWIMTTSGTTGRPKMLVHTLERLARTVQPLPKGETPVWGLTYEPTRFAGMQVLLQSVLGGGTLVSPASSLPLGDRLTEFASEGVTHLSATPTLWRRILMHPASSNLAPKQITLGGEIVDQALLDRLATRFPKARITHIYASTEVGVGFSVKDKREGFPADWLEDGPDSVSMKIEHGRLWLRVSGVGDLPMSDCGLLKDDEGHIDTLDRVERRGDRVVFLGRETGVVNVGGSKVYPETVEAVLNSFPNIALSHVGARKNPFSGEILVAQVVVDTPPKDPEAFRIAIMQHCRETLPKEAVPAVIKVVDELDMNVAGKLMRRN